ncbi:hypothetical protein NDU88_002020 [Pleurodeles waltl]|uniref:Uncharacterized protein n=1 Tax=Pleurodeles waltl TaxID=8319 RepID=A0AAV7M9T6_PLEWA|nr:hypothetical protein NDU88_002020 [Pleurodeles waltl]
MPRLLQLMVVHYEHGEQLHHDFRVLRPQGRRVPAAGRPGNNRCHVNGRETLCVCLDLRPLGTGVPAVGGPLAGKVATETMCLCLGSKEC